MQCSELKTKQISKKRERNRSLKGVDEKLGRRKIQIPNARTTNQSITWQKFDQKSRAS